MMKNSEILALTSKKRLAHFLECDLRDLSLFASDTCYRVFEAKPKGKLRRCEVPDGPNGGLKRAHDLVKNALREEALPDWLYSCRGKDYVKNAACHACPNNYVINMDISKFYPSCTRHYVLQLFADKNFYGLPPDVAELLSKILTYQGHIPTGSSASSYLAFWSYYNCFKEIFRFATAKKYKVTLYVDDLTLSSPKNFPAKYREKCVRTIGNIMERYGLPVNEKKTRIAGPCQEKKVTGVKITPKGEMLPPDELMRKIDWENSIPKRERNPRRLVGLLAARDRIRNFCHKL